jgi:aminoglycoside phosphotransferase (APT) family kinase protein
MTEPTAPRRRAEDTAPVRAGEDLDWPRVADYLRAKLPGLDGNLEVRQFPNGSANLTYLLRFGGRPLVLRRPPFGRIAPGAHDMSREHRVLSRLWRAFAPAPRALLLCEDESVVGAKFFVMEFRSGVVIWDAIPGSMRHHSDVARRAGFAVVRALADLHQVDYARCGLEDLGRPDGFVARQVRGWRSRWDAVARGDAQPVMLEVADLLELTRPEPQCSAILHNDLKLDNCQFDPADPDRVHSVFDWDMATLGDPLVDVGTLLNYWPDPADAPGDRGMYPDGLDRMGLPTQAEISACYAEATGLDLAGIRWYQAFACWKTAIVLQQLYDRYLRGETADERMADRGDRVAELAARARRLLREGGDETPAAQPPHNPEGLTP